MSELAPATSGDPLGRRPPPPRSGWEVLDSARARGFTGELEFELDPPAHVYLERGEVYLAECEGDPPIGSRLVAAEALTVHELDAGTVEVAGETHLGRLFERVPSVDRSTVLVALEVLSGETLAWVAGQMSRSVVSRPYVFHPSGVNRWYTSSAAAVSPPQLPAPLPPTTPQRAGRDRPLRGWRPSSRRAGAERTGDLRIEWLDENVGPSRSPLPMPPPSSPPPPATSTGTPENPQHRGSEQAGFEGFEVVWPSGEVETAGATQSSSGSVQPGPEQPGAELPPPAIEPEPDDGARSVPSDTEQMRLAVRRTVSAIEEGLVRGQPIEPSIPVADALVDPFDRWSGDSQAQTFEVRADLQVDPDDPFEGWSGVDIAGPGPDRSDDPFGGWDDLDTVDDVIEVSQTDLHDQRSSTVRRGTLSVPHSGSFASGTSISDDERRTALQRLIDGLRRR